MAYLDHAATTPIRPEAIEAMERARRITGNPSSLHAAGRAARRVVEESREAVAAAFGADPAEVIFTSGGTESDNLAVKGLYWAQQAADQRRRRLVISPVEHHAVLDAARWLADRQGAELILLDIDADGVVTPDALTAALAADPHANAAVSIMWANNETGVVQPIPGLAAAAGQVPFHTDAVQAAGARPIAFAASGAAALTVSAHKLGGPVGIGALLLRRDVALEPVLHGGGQERDVRSGTLDALAAAGFAAAATAAQADDHDRIANLRDRLIDGIRNQVPDVVVTAERAERLPGIAHLMVPGCDSEALLMLLDAAGVECSAGSACTAGVNRVSHVIEAMAVDPVLARGSLRFSLGRTSTADDVAAVVRAMPSAVERARAALVPGVRR
jgi:cysteine desulfurase